MTSEVLQDVALNERLKIAMVKAKISNQDLAKEANVQPPNMSNIVNNGIRPRLETAQRIVRALNKRGVEVTIDDLWPLEE